MGELAQIHFRTTGTKTVQWHYRPFLYSTSQPVLYVRSSVKSFCCISLLDHSPQVISPETVFLGLLHHHIQLPAHTALSTFSLLYSNPIFFLLIIHLNTTLLLLIIRVDLYMFIIPLLPHCHFLLACPQLY